MQKTYQLSKFPNVLGYIDGKHIAVRSPSKDEHLFVNRKCLHFNFNYIKKCSRGA